MTENHFFWFYLGTSMEGTFQPGDQLEVESLSLNELKQGDVVVFHDLGTHHAIVHRVVGFDRNGLRTCGDSNPIVDIGWVTSENFLGLVTHYKRAGHKREVWNGKAGFYWSRWLHMRKELLCYLKLLGIGFYSIFRKIHIIKWFWNPTIKQIIITSGENILVKYLHNGRTVARWWPARHYFECRKPYDLVIPNPEKSKQS